MYIRTLSLKHFRSWQQQTFEFKKETNLIVGPNTSGKTNILEAIFLLAMAKGFDYHKLEDLITKEVRFAKVEAVIIDANGYEHLLNLNLVKDNNRIKRSYLIGGTRVTRRRFIDEFKVIFFEPSDLNFILGSPSRRRRYIDRFLSGYDWQYQQALTAYARVIKQRNNLLSQIKMGKAGINSLWPWNRLLIKHNQTIQNRRRFLIDQFNKDQEAKDSPIRLNYVISAVDDYLLKQEDKIKQEVQKEITLWGSHRDDFIFKWTEDDLVNYGSRGQHRLAIFELLLSQQKIIYKQSQKTPILLFDDIMSELDDQFVKLIIDRVKDSQVIITGVIDRQLSHELNLIRLS